MPILFCERCGRDADWVYLGNAVCCRSCGWQMSLEEFKAYRKRILKEEFEKFLQKERENNWMEKLYDELENEVLRNPELAEEVHRRNMKELERIARKFGLIKRQKPVLGAPIL